MMENINIFAVFHICVLIHHNMANPMISLASVQNRSPITLPPGKPTRPGNIDGENIVFGQRTEYKSVQSEQFDRDPELSDELLKEWQEAQEKEIRNMNVHQIPISTFRPNITFAEDRMMYRMPTNTPTINNSTKSIESSSSPSGFNFVCGFKNVVFLLCILVFH